MNKFDFTIGAQVYCKDKTCGKLHKVVIEPPNQRVTDLIVARGFLWKTDRVLPVSAVERASDQGVYLFIGSDEIDNCPEYQEVEFMEPALGWGEAKQYKAANTVYQSGPCKPICQEPVVPMVQRRVQEGIQSNKEAIGAGTLVQNLNGDLGKVDHVLVAQENGEIIYLIARKGIIPGYIVIPIEMVESMSEAGIFVKLTDEEFEELPRYKQRYDADILTELQDRLKASRLNFDDIDVTLESGLARLTGRVRDAASKRRAEAMARSVDEVIDVENALYTDTAVTARVNATLMDDQRTQVANIQVINEQGLITLTGQVDRSETQKAAEEIAERQPGVVCVINVLEVKPDEVPMHLIPEAGAERPHPLLR